MALIILARSTACPIPMVAMPAHNTKKIILSKSVCKLKQYSMKQSITWHSVQIRISPRHSSHGPGRTIHSSVGPHQHPHHLLKERERENWSFSRTNEISTFVPSWHWCLHTRKLRQWVCFVILSSFTCLDVLQDYWCREERGGCMWLLFSQSDPTFLYHERQLRYIEFSSVCFII